MKIDGRTDLLFQIKNIIILFYLHYLLMVMYELGLDKPGYTAFLLGNEAIARGLIEAGIDVAAGYPGTPSSEIIDSLGKVASKFNYYVEWSTNEKVALEIAFGASLCGLRGFAAMKHVGLNVASDIFMSIGYSGVKGGLLIVSADDPSCHSSQNEQDNRYYGMHGYIPVIEPASPMEAKQSVLLGYDISEKTGSAILLRSTTRLSHVRGNVILGEIRPNRGIGKFMGKVEELVMVPRFSQKLHGKALERLEKIREKFEKFPLNKMKINDTVYGIIASGVAYNYVMDFLYSKNLLDKVSILKLSTTYPLPLKSIEKFIENVEKILVVEELEPIIENQIKVLLFEKGLKKEIHGKDLVPRVLELTPEKVATALSIFLKIPLPNYIKFSEKIKYNIPQRPPTFCPGCPHRATFYELKIAVAKSKVKPIYSGDIGCYTLGFNPPFKATHSVLCMGASIGLANGIAHSSDELPIALIGDSTFYHAGIPGLINAVYNNARMLVIVMDNGVTAMTGMQPHPGSGKTLMGKKVVKILPEKIAEAIGIKHVSVIDPYDVKDSIEKIMDAIQYVVNNKSVGFIVSRRLCALEAMRLVRRKGEKIYPYYIDQDICTKCMICINAFSCPAIIRENNLVKIDENLCTGCGVCVQICPFNAIKR